MWIYKPKVLLNVTLKKKEEKKEVRLANKPYYIKLFIILCWKLDGGGGLIRASSRLALHAITDSSSANQVLYKINLCFSQARCCGCEIPLSSDFHLPPPPEIDLVSPLAEREYPWD